MTSLADNLRGELDALTTAVGRLGESDSPARVSTRIQHGIDRVVACAMAERDSLLHELDRLAADLARVTAERDALCARSAVPAYICGVCGRLKQSPGICECAHRR